MNKKQMVCLLVGILSIVATWLYQFIYTEAIDTTFLIIVSVLLGMLTGGFVLTFKSGSSQ